MSRQERNNRIIGIDPGSYKCGYGIVEKSSDLSKGCIYISSGTIEMPAKEPLQVRLKSLFEGLTSVISEYRPQEASVEKIFYAKGIKAALSLGHARGVALLSASIVGIDVFEYSALEVKKAVTGYGKAEKRQVQEMIKAILGLYDNGRKIGCPAIPPTGLSEDASDALALAVCHVNSSTFKSLLKDTMAQRR